MSMANKRMCPSSAGQLVRKTGYDTVVVGEFMRRMRKMGDGRWKMGDVREDKFRYARRHAFLPFGFPVGTRRMFRIHFPIRAGHLCWMRHLAPPYFGLFLAFCGEAAYSSNIHVESELAGRKGLERIPDVHYVKEMEHWCLDVLIPCCDVHRTLARQGWRRYRRTDHAYNTLLIGPVLSFEHDMITSSQTDSH